MTDQEKAEDRVGFSAYILLSEAIQFNSSEIEQALLEDYPSLDLRTETGFGMNQDCDTDQFITTPILLGATGADSTIATLIRLPGYGTWDPEQLTPWQRLPFPEVTQAFQYNKSYICVTTGAEAGDEIQAFRAARLCSCVAAIFAKLPVALAVYWESADHFLRPSDVVAMADKAISDEIPIEQWVGLRLQGTKNNGKQLFGGVTNGLKPLKGFEVSLAAAPLDLENAAATLSTTAAMLAAYGHNFNDGDTLGHEGQSREDSMRIRFAPKGTNGSFCDAWVLVHPQSPFDHEEELGVMTSSPPPPGQEVQVRSKTGFFKRLMRGSRDA
ncbi:hypothetical protein [Ruegeria sp.]|uniref:hypothetical protein n=1 Tax=Ruegeria sp. TaxID=1879320 RepID=UPI003B593968